MPMPSMNRARELRAQVGVGRGRRAGIVAPDVEDAGRGDERRRRVQDRADVGDVRRAAHPPRAVAELLDDLRRLAGAFGAERAVAGPDADLSDVHPRSLPRPIVRTIVAGSPDSINPRYGILAVL